MKVRTKFTIGWFVTLTTWAVSLSAASKFMNDNSLVGSIFLITFIILMIISLEMHFDFSRKNNEIIKIKEHAICPKHGLTMETIYYEGDYHQAEIILKCSKCNRRYTVYKTFSPLKSWGY